MSNNLRINFIVEFDRNNSPIELKDFFDNTEVLLRGIYEKFFNRESFFISISIFQNVKELCKNFYGNNDKTGNFSYAMYVHDTNTIKACIPNRDEFEIFQKSIIFAFSRALLLSFPSKQSEIYDYLRELVLSPFSKKLSYKYSTELFTYHCEVTLSQKTIVDLDNNLTKTYEKTLEIWDFKEYGNTDILIFQNYKSFYDSFFSDGNYKGVLGILAGISPCHMVVIPNPECIEKDTNGKKNYVDMLQAAAHEFVHRINLIKDPYNSIPCWVFEGIAEKLTNNHLVDGLKQIAKNTFEIEKVFSENLDDFHCNYGYVIAPIVLNYIENQYGKTILKQILNSSRSCLEFLYSEIQDDKLRHAKFIKECDLYITRLIKDVQNRKKKRNS